VTVYFRNDVLPLFQAEVGANGQLRTSTAAHLGTGFLIAPGVLVTCAHCLPEPLPSGHEFCATIQIEGEWRGYGLTSITRSPHVDLATAKIELKPEIPLRLATDTDPVTAGDDVRTFGFPLLDRMPEGGFVVSPRALKGYVTRPFYYRPLTGGPEIKSYELDMRTPAGLSGAPLLRGDGFEVIGVIYGSNDVEKIEEFVRVDPETGERTGELTRIFSFGLAHYTTSLQEFAGGATNGLPLLEYIRREAGQDALS
jgi:hypothetical protein